MIPRRGFLATLAAIACAPVAAIRRLVQPGYGRLDSLVKVETVGDSGGFIVPKEFEAVILSKEPLFSSMISYRPLTPTLTLEEVCRLRGVKFERESA